MCSPDALSRDELLVLVEDLLMVNREQQERIAWLEAEVARLQGGPPGSVGKEPPAFVKPNRPAKEKRPRKRRAHGFARKREDEPTRVVEHAPSRCSRCGRKLSDGWVHASRQVIEIPVVPAEVVEHRFLARHCGVCHRREFARPDLSAEVLGKCRLGVRLMSLIGYLDTVCRMPLAGMQRLLFGLWGLRVSEGELVRVLHTLAGAGARPYDALLTEARRSGFLHADETGAREEGVNGHLWSLSTPTVRYYHRDPSRGAAVIQKLLGYDPQVFAAPSARAVRAARAAATPQEPFAGVLVSDFYAGYAWYSRTGGWHQGCLVHLARDLHALKAPHAEEPGVCAWVEQVQDLLARAKESARVHASAPKAVRRRLRRAFEQEAEALGRPYSLSALPQRVLAERLVKQRGKLFVFVEHPDVPSDNNAAERAIRPFVVVRKVSGGTRSAAGSRTQSVLLSLFGTWLLRGLDALEECRQMLISRPDPAPT